MELRNARVWLTGASSGIGAALVPPLLAAGARVAVSARRAGQLESLAAGWRAGGEVLVVPLDVTDREAVRAAVAAIESAWGGIDLAILNAGTHSRAASREFDADQYRHIFELNVFGVVYGVEAVLPGMIARGRGHIAGMASLAGYRALPTAGAYGSSKAALIHLLDAIRFDLRRHDIGVTVISPGFVRTPLTDKNRFRMPFLMDADRAAALIVRGLARGKREIHFPAAFSWTLKLLRVLPYPVYERIVSRATRSRRVAHDERFAR